MTLNARDAVNLAKRRTREEGEPYHASYYHDASGRVVWGVYCGVPGIYTRWGVFVRCMTPSEVNSWAFKASG